MTFRAGHTWSHTLSLDLATCTRRVYYRVYGSWGGWGAHAEANEATYCYLAKQSKTLPMYGGTLVHEVIRRILERLRVAPNGLASKDVLIKRLQERMRSEIAYSASHTWGQLDNPKQATLILYPHLVGSDLKDSEIEDAITRYTSCLEAFLDTYLPELLQVGPENWIVIDSLDRVDYEDYSLYVAPDLAHRDGDSLVITDWKTGGRPDLEQLQVYGLYLEHWIASKKSTIGSQNFKKIGRSVPLLVPDNIGTLEITPEHLQNARERINRDLAQLRPLETAGEARDKSAFPRTEHRGRCTGCLYRHLCETDDV